MVENADLEIRLGYSIHRLDDSAVSEDLNLQGVSLDGGGQSSFSVFPVGKFKTTLESTDFNPYFFAGGGVSAVAYLSLSCLQNKNRPNWKQILSSHLVSQLERAWGFRIPLEVLSWLTFERRQIQSLRVTSL